MSYEKPIKTYRDYQLYLGSRVRAEHTPCCEQDKCYGIECEEKHKPNFICQYQLIIFLPQLL